MSEREFIEDNQPEGPTVGLAAIISLIPIALSAIQGIQRIIAARKMGREAEAREIIKVRAEQLQLHQRIQQDGEAAELWLREHGHLP